MGATRTCLRLLLLSFLLFTCTDAQSDFIIKNVTLSVHPSLEVERGTNLTLTCNAQFSHAGAHLPQHTYNFYKDFEIANDMQPMAARGKETLHISQARAFHSGTYYCEMVIEKQKKMSCKKKVVVKGLQKPELIVDRQKVTEGENVSAICKAEEEKGSLTFSFKDDNSEVFRAKTENGQVQHSITLNSGRTAKLSCSYVTNFEGRPSSEESNIVNVEVQELSITPSIRIQPSTQVIEADTVNITCQVPQSYQNSQALKLKLSKGTMILKRDMKSDHYSKVVQAADSGEYECYAEMNSISKKAAAQLNVKELFSHPVLTITPDEVYEGQQLTITCESYEFASERIQKDAVKYYIHRNEQLVTPGAFDGTYTTKAGSETNGNYTCKAQVRNISKWSQNQIFRAKVLVSRPMIQVVDQVVLGRPFRINCFSENGSFPITYTLKRNNNPLNRSLSRHRDDLAIFPAIVYSEQQIHEFRCEAKNSPFTSLMSVALSVPVIVPVGQVFLTVIPMPDDVTEGHDVVLICQVSKGTPPVSFRWYHSDSKRLLLSDTTMSNFSSHTLRHVSSKDSGSYYCEGFNSGTDASMSNKITFTVRMARWKKGVIAGSCLLCVSVTVFCLVMRYRAKRGTVALNGSRRMNETDGPQDKMTSSVGITCRILEAA
ncbi:platelet endothelial cell adhesion molecule isoform X2 [Astyanax mexicanus]|uniref:platelet endothelial cell adhesion molecule isoform X2 n=1 Tax=Astyanax mexicanus TaxID=7994 RepID=UPI0020CAEC89|nr:platelet endothelial cell adhesion molecule isoform X2 [Astyanax mexicanus]